MFDDILKAAQIRLEKNDSQIEFEELLDEASKIFFETTKDTEKDNLLRQRKEHQEFIDRNCKRWGSGLDKLELHYIATQEAAFWFQEYYLSFSELENDPLLGVLMRLHANACRITSEIIHLIKGGYPDGALARWRTLFEISVTCLIIHKYGKSAAVDYIRHGYIKNVEGIEEYQKTAEKMGVEPYTDKELEDALKLKEALSEGEIHWHWARKFTGYSKLEKLRGHVDLDGWSHYYKLASRNIHADYSEMRTLLGMEEANEDLLLIGQSNSGMTLPAHATAIMLNQITSCFLTAYIQEEEIALVYTKSILFMKLLTKYEDDVGREFLNCQ